MTFIVFFLILQAFLYKNENCIGTPHFIALHFIDLCKYYIFYKLKVCGNPESSKSISAIFSNSICLLHVSVSHFGNSHNISNFFISIITDLWWTIFDVTITKR